MVTISKGTAAFYDRSVSQMASLREETERLQNQIATGERLAISSDDPIAASRLRSLSRQDRLAAVDSDNASRAGEKLQQTDNALQTIANEFARARELAVQAATGTLSDAQRSLIGDELAQIYEGLFAAANFQDSEGNSLFSGQGTGAAYTADAAGNPVYAGFGTAGEISLGEGMNITSGVTGPEVFDFTTDGTATNMLVFVKGLADALKGASADPATDARNALGGFDDALESLTRAQTVVGARVAWIETVQDRQILTSETRAQETADTGGTEYTSTVARLQQMLVVLEASQASFVRIGQLSLFNSI